MTVKIALLGTGGMGKVHFNNYKVIDGVEVVCILGTSQDASEMAEEWNLKHYPYSSSIPKELDVDIVDVCLPTFLHYEAIIEALSNRYSVICEKPLVLKSKQIDEIEHLLKANNLNLYIGQVVQFSKETEYLRTVINDQRFGKVLDGYFERLSQKPQWISGSWLFEKEKSGLLPFDLHIHDLDLIVSMFGNPKDFSYRSTKSASSQINDHYRFIYDFDGFSIGSECSWYNASIPFTARWRVYFDKALLVFEGGKLTVYEENNSYEVDIKDEIRIPTEINLPPTGMFYRELKHFTDCYKKGIESPYTNVRQSKSVIQILEKIEVE